MDTLRYKSIGEASFGEKTGSGIISCYGTLDRHGDVIMPGAFSSEVLSTFLAEGSVNLNHFEPLSIGYPTEIHDDGKNIRSSWKYHSTPDAIAAWTVAKERQEAKKSTGLSIGFRVSKMRVFESGAALLGWAQVSGYDMTQFDTAKIAGRDRHCWAIEEISDLFEFSQVTTPSNPLARTEHIKSIFGEGSHAGLSADDHLEIVLAAVQGAAERIRNLSETRKADGRVLSQKRKDQAKALIEELSQIIKDSANSKSLDSDLILRAQATLLGA